MSFKKTIHYLFLFILFSTNCGQSQKLIWSDEFNYTGKPDPSKWGYEIGLIRNNELQYYTSREENAFVEKGFLKITANKEKNNGNEYSSASINTKGKFGFTYGKIEARISFPFGAGLWPAFWTLGNNIDVVGWPSCGEIDVMEHINSESYVHGTVHWAGDDKSHKKSGATSHKINPEQFHIYSVDWTKDSISWYMDNVKYYSVPVRQLNGGDIPELHKPHYLLLNYAIGGNWPGAPSVATQFPTYMLVDYVRVYQK